MEMMKTRVNFMDKVTGSFRQHERKINDRFIWIRFFYSP